MHKSFVLLSRWTSVKLRAFFLFPFCVLLDKMSLAFFFIIIIFFFIFLFSRCDYSSWRYFVLNLICVASIYFFSVSRNFQENCTSLFFLLFWFKLDYRFRDSKRFLCSANKLIDVWIQFVIWLESISFRISSFSVWIGANGVIITNLILIACRTSKLND